MTNSQMFQIGVPDGTIVRVVLLKSEKEIFQPPAGQIREHSGGTVGIDATGFSAVTRFPIGNQGHVTGFSTAESIARKQITIVKDGHRPRCYSEKDKRRRKADPNRCLPQKHLHLHRLKRYSAMGNTIVFPKKADPAHRGHGNT